MAKAKSGTQNKKKNIILLSVIGVVGVLAVLSWTGAFDALWGL